MISFLSSAYLYSHLVREGVLWGIRVFCAICVVQLVVLVLHKLAVERRERREALLKSRYLARMYRSLVERRVMQSKPATREEYDALSDVCIYLMSSASAAELRLIADTARECGIADFYGHELARSHFWITKYQLVEKLGFLKLLELAPVFRRVLDEDEDQPQVVAKAAWALSLICREEDLPHLFARMSAPNFMSAKFNEHLFGNIIAAFRGRGESRRLLSLLSELLEGESIPLLVKRDFIEACGAAGFGEAEALITWSAQHLEESPEMRIACLRSMQKLGGGKVDSFILAGMRDSDWRVRAVAAKSVQRCSNDVVPALEEALSDQSYHVRVNAALSLAHKGEEGRAALSRQTGSRDRFVREVSRYVLRDTEVSC
ncbi:HEAT repeat domain-containing protein [Geomonas sp. RF6]|uniref:HEAT repeat domain-containing protein n=1 Tax=Geomonas sp. RF6 TaxID=2897342 RepID=UPI001E5C3280|nr:HEAT repeat domain-containing protein [Geomonas sp. RF6]UFS72880.1 HEAT repeat domain-containing protein [Geomonas sp. RF6]